MELLWALRLSVLVQLSCLITQQVLVYRLFPKCKKYSQEVHGFEDILSTTPKYGVPWNIGNILWASVETARSLWPPLFHPSLKQVKRSHVKGALPVPGRRKTFLSPEMRIWGKEIYTNKPDWTNPYLTIFSPFSTPRPNSSVLPIFHKCIVSLSKMDIKASCLGHFFWSLFFYEGSHVPVKI